MTASTPVKAGATAPTPATWLLRRWLLSRGLLLVLFALETTARSDIGYYATHLVTLLGPGEAGGTMREYPTPVLGLLTPLWLAAGQNLIAFHLVFAAAMLAADAAFTRHLWAATGRSPSPAMLLWLVALPVLGPVSLARFDLLPGVLAASALLLLVRRPAWAGGFVAAGAALKLWPVLLLPALAARREGRTWVVTGALGSGLALAALSLLAGGVDRLLSPLSFQGVRGLQIESLPALPLMVGWVFDKSRWQVFYGEANSNEVTGPLAGAMLTATTLLTAAMFVVLLVLWARAWRRGREISAGAVAWVVLATIALLVVTNKVFSPQYLLWLIPVVTVALLLTPGRTASRVTVLTVGAAALTHLVYPLLYGTVVDPGPLNGLGVLLLLLRDAALVWLTALAVREAWRATSKAATTSTGAVLGDAGEVPDRQRLAPQGGVDAGST